MPVVQHSTYKAPSILYKSAHYATIVPGLYRQYPNYPIERERLELVDGDFLDLDWRKQRAPDKKENNHKLLILSHGLEGSSNRPYITATADYFYQRGYSTLAWNQRGCSGEINRNLRFYHHGVYDDLNTVIEHALAQGYEAIYLIGFSMGAAVGFNYLGHIHGQQPMLDSRIKGIVGISTPLDITESARFINEGFNRVYVRNFLGTLKTKVSEKAIQFPAFPNLDKLDKVRSFKAFDNYYTAPLHGFKDGADYYHRVSPLRVLSHIKVPALAINALNDPMLGESCYPYEIAEKHPYFYLETPKHGGHCGFPLKGSTYSWAEIRAFEFFEKNILISNP